MQSRLPPQNKLPKSYYNWLMREVNREDEAEIELPPIPPYTKEKMVWTEVSKRAFASLITQFKI